MSNKIKDIYYWLKKSNTNLDDALYIYKNIDELAHFKKTWSKPTIVERYIHAFIIFFKRIITFFDTRRVSNPLPKNITTILYVNSNNTFHSLEFLKTLEKVCFFEQSNRISPYQSQRGSIVHNIKTPLWITILSFFNFPIYALFFWKKSFKHPHLYFENWGKEYVNMKLLKNYKNINKVVFANDHNVENRLFKISCENQKIKTIYLQHASVTNLFPKLDFDQSFLFGKVDLMKYVDIGTIKGEVVLAGSPKFDELYQHRRKANFEKTHTFGIALNLIDEVEKIELLIATVLMNTSYNIVIRMHPGDRRIFSFNSKRVKLHNANEIPLIDFFGEIDFLISGESSIHLESLYLKIPSFFVELTSKPTKDYYQILKSGLVKYFKIELSTDELFQKFSSSEMIDELKLKNFIQSVGENYDGKVGELIINEIKNNIEA